MGTSVITKRGLDQLTIVAAELCVRHWGMEGRGPRYVGEWLRLVRTAYLFRWEYPFRAAKLKYLSAELLSGGVTPGFGELLERAAADRNRSRGPGDEIVEMVHDHLVAGGSMKKTARLGVKGKAVGLGQTLVYAHPLHSAFVDMKRGVECQAYEREFRGSVDFQTRRSAVMSFLDKTWGEHHECAVDLVRGDLGSAYVEVSAPVVPVEVQEPAVAEESPAEEEPAKRKRRRSGAGEIGPGEQAPGISVVSHPADGVGSEGITVEAVAEAVTAAHAALEASKGLVLGSVLPAQREAVSRVLSSTGEFLAADIMNRLR